MTSEILRNGVESPVDQIPTVAGISYGNYEGGKHIFGYLFSEEAAEQMKQWLTEHKEEVTTTKIGTKPPLRLETTSPNLQLDFPWAHRAIFPGITVYDKENKIKHDLILRAIESLGWKERFIIIKVTRW